MYRDQLGQDADLLALVRNRPVKLNDQELIPGPTDHRWNQSRESRWSQIGLPTTRITAPTPLELVWSRIVGDWPVAQVFRAIERALLGAANVADTLRYEWAECLHKIEVDYKVAYGYLTTYQTSVESLGRGAKAWSVRLGFSLVNLSEARQNAFVPPILFEAGDCADSFFTSFSLPDNIPGRAGCPTSVTWEPPSRSVSMTPKTCLVTAPLREPGTLRFGWSRVPNVIFTGSPNTITIPVDEVTSLRRETTLLDAEPAGSGQKTILSDYFAEALNIGDYVTVCGYNPCSGEYGQVALGRICEVSCDPLAGLPYLCNATLGVALAARLAAQQS